MRRQLFQLYPSRCPFWPFAQGFVVSIKNGYVAGINDGLSAKETIDLRGMYLAPGLVDGHVHIESSLLTPAEYAKVVILTEPPL